MKKEIGQGMTTEYVYDLLKEMIFGWKLPPGQKININHLAKTFNISTIPLREALSRLHSTKLVVFEPNKGYRVSDILSRKGMEDLLEARVLMETNAVRQIIRAEGKHQKVAEQLNQIHQKICSIQLGTFDKEVLEFNQLDRQFHAHLMQAAENAFLFEAYEGMHCHLHIARFYHLRGAVDKEETVVEHADIIEAIRTRDVYRAENAVSKHIEDAKYRLLEN